MKHSPPPPNTHHRCKTASLVSKAFQHFKTGAALFPRAELRREHKNPYSAASWVWFRNSVTGELEIENENKQKRGAPLGQRGNEDLQESPPPGPRVRKRAGDAALRPAASPLPVPPGTEPPGQLSLRGRARRAQEPAAGSRSDGPRDGHPDGPRDGRPAAPPALYSRT